MSFKIEADVVGKNTRLFISFSLISFNKWFYSSSNTLDDQNHHVPKLSLESPVGKLQGTYQKSWFWQLNVGKLPYTISQRDFRRPNLERADGS